MTTADETPDTEDDESPTRDFVEAMADTYEAMQTEMTERQAAAIAEVNRLGLAWHNDPYLAPWCRHLGASMGRVGADLRVGFPVVRTAYKALLVDPVPMDFVTTILAAHPDASDPKLQRELLAEAELSIICLRHLWTMVQPLDPETDVPRFVKDSDHDGRLSAAIYKFIDTIVDALAWMVDQSLGKPATH